MNIIITGATGMVGSEVVRQAINDPGIRQINLIIRRRSGFDHPKVKEYIHTDFMKYDGLEEVFKGSDACIWCLGISQSRVSRSEYYDITYNYTVAAAKAMVTANPEISFLFLSAQGADRKERSLIRFTKVKGQAENALIRLHLKRLFIFRPFGIQSSTPSPEKEGFSKKMEKIAVKIMRMVWPWSVVSARELALAMLKVIKEGYPEMILNHRTIKKLVSGL